MITAAMMRIITPVASPPRNIPTSVAAFEAGGSLTSACGSGVDVGLGCGSGVQEGLHTLTMVAV